MGVGSLDNVLPIASALRGLNDVYALEGAGQDIQRKHLLLKYVDSLVVQLMYGQLRVANAMEKLGIADADLKDKNVLFSLTGFPIPLIRNELISGLPFHG